MLAFASDRGGKGPSQHLDPADRQPSPIQLTDNESTTVPRFLADGTRIAFSRGVPTAMILVGAGR